MGWGGGGWVVRSTDSTTARTNLKRINRVAGGGQACVLVENVKEPGGRKVENQGGSKDK